MKSGTRLLAVAGLIVTLLFLAGCSGEIGIGSSTTEGGGQTTTTSGEAETTTTEAAQTTTTSGEAETTTTEAAQTATTSGETDTTAAADTGDGTSNTVLFVIIGVVLLLVLIIAINASRRSRKATAAAGSAAAAPSWKVTAERAYSHSRWLYENLTPEIAQWRGDWLHTGEGRSGGQASDIASAQQQTWNELATQMTAAATTLYGLEAQVDPASQPVVRSLIDGLNGTRTAVDDVASARLAVNQATDAFRGDSGNQRVQQDLSVAHERENQSVQHLNARRSVLYGALTNLSALR